jgi:hypothetical protein
LIRNSSCVVSVRCLHLETLGASATTGTLELATLGLDEGLLVGVGTEAEVLVGLTGSLGATDEDHVGASGGAEGELVEGDALTAGGDNAGTGGGSEAEGADGELGALSHADVVGDLGNGGHDLALVLLVGGRPLVEGGDLGEGNGGPLRRKVSRAQNAALPLALEGQGDLLCIFDILRRRRTTWLKAESVLRAKKL